MAALAARAVLIAVLLACAGAAWGDINFRFQNWEDPDAVPWSEGKYELPPYPKADAPLIEFYTNAVNPNHYYVDSSSLSVGEDGVVRYVMVVKTSGGAVNVSFEGMRCETQQLRIYAIGRSDGTWYVSPRSEWKPMKTDGINYHQGKLWRNFLCPIGNPIHTAKEGVDALKAGRHPSVPGDAP